VQKNMESGRVFQGMALALGAAYVYSLAGLCFFLGAPSLTQLPRLLAAALLVLLPFPIVVILLLGGVAGAVVGRCASRRLGRQAWFEGAWIGGSFGAVVALLSVLHFNTVWQGTTGASVALFWPVIPYCAAWGAAVEGFWARHNLVAATGRT
jgi:hypothetical protein